MNDNLHANPNQKFDHEIDKANDIKELDQKIREGERSLREAEANRVNGFLPLLGSLGIVIAMGMKISVGGPPYVLITLIALTYSCFNIWRLYSADKKIKQRASELKAHLDRMVELQSRSETTE